MTTIKEDYLIEGMICRQCEDIVETALLHTKGVINVKASYWKSKVIIEYDPSIVSAAELKDTLAQCGYPAGGNRLSGIIIDLICAVCVAGVFLLLPVLKSIPIPKAVEGATYGFIFLIGLLTSTHCVGMCGGIMLSQTTNSRFSIPNKRTNSVFGLLSSLYYNGGRVLSYTIMGAIFGALGSVLSYTMSFKSMVFTLAGALVLIIGIQMWGIIPGFRKLSLQLPSFCALPDGAKKKFYGKPLIIGLLTGVMPCAPLQAMWIYSMGTGSAVKGALSMLIFVLGTVPLMFIFGAFSSLIPKKYYKYMVKLSSVLITTMGLSMFIKGIQLFNK